MIKAQANEETIEQQYANIEDKKGQIEKLNLECTVVVTEKAQTKKELDRIDGLYIKLQKEFKEQRVQFDMLVDEISKVSRQNSDYRGLILSNEQKMSNIQKEIQDLQQLIKVKNKQVKSANEEKMVSQKQFE